MTRREVFVAVMVLCSTSQPVLADDWVAAKLRGGVFAYVDQGWVQVYRGDAVPDGTVLRTQKHGRAQFVRGAEMVELGPDTQVQILDEDGRRFTTIKQWYGTVAVEAEARNVEHFAVRTPDLAAVVKGTRFVVGAGSGESAVTVLRGHVAVEDVRTHASVTVAAGQSVSTGVGGIMQVAGSGPLPAPKQAGGAPAAARGGQGEDNARPGNSGNAPGHGGESPGNSSNAPGHGGEGPGNSSNAPGHGGEGPGNSGNAPGHGGDSG